MVDWRLWTKIEKAGSGKPSDRTAPRARVSVLDPIPWLHKGPRRMESRIKRPDTRRNPITRPNRQNTACI